MERVELTEVKEECFADLTRELTVVSELPHSVQDALSGTGDSDWDRQWIKAFRTPAVRETQVPSGVSTNGTR